MQRMFALLFPVLFLAMPFAAGAATAAPAPGLSACSALYAIGDVRALVSGTTATATPGSALPLSVIVQNDSELPIANGGVYAKVYRLSTSASAPQSVSNFLEIARHVDIATRHAQEFSFSVPLASDEPAGKYRVAVVVTPGNGFDPEASLVLGNPAANGIYDFSIPGTFQGAVTLVPGTATTTDPSATDPVHISVQALNTTEKDFSGMVHWKLYAWDSADPLSPVSTGESELTVSAHGHAVVSYVLTDSAHSLYDLVGEIDSVGGAKSIVDFPLSRFGASGARISYLAAARMPLAAGENAAIACISGAGLNPPHVNVILSVTRNGILSLLGPIASASYNGVAPSTPGALLASAHADASSFTVTAKLYDDSGRLIESESVPYQCGGAQGPCDYTTEIAIAVGVFIIIVLAWLTIFKKREDRAPAPRA